MFWRFNYMPSKVDSLLDKENVTLEELMDEDDIVQECKSQNKKLVDFLVLPNNMEQLVNMITKSPVDDLEEKMKYKYPNIACDLITSDVNQITDTIATSEALLQSIYTFLEGEGPLNPLQASFFSKVMGLLITRKSEVMVEFFKTRDNFIGHLLRHLGTSAIMDLLLRLVTCIESTECRTDCINWLASQQLVSRLIALIDASETAEKHTNAAQSLCDIIRLSREQTSQSQDGTTQDELLTAIETQEAVTELLEHMFGGEPAESVIVNGLYVIQTLLESRKIGQDGLQEPMSLLDSDHLSPGVSNTLLAIIPKFSHIHKLLDTPPKQHYCPMPTTLGGLDQPLGLTRLQVARLVSSLIMTNQTAVNQQLAQHGTIALLLDLFFQYTWNNFLHAQVEQCIVGILTSTLPDNPLQKQLFHEFHILERIATAFDDNKSQQSVPGKQRRGYMGHLTRVANQLAGCNAEPSLGSTYTTTTLWLTETIQELPEAERDHWTECVSGLLADINKLNSTEIGGGGGGGGLASSSEDDDEFRSISFPQDDAMQKAFCDYQLQQMTSNFIDQFGFSEDDFAEQEECIGSPFTERISSINFELNTIEDNPTAAAMFEHACNDRIHQFDSNDSDEDLWEKEVGYSQLSENRPSSAVVPPLRNVSNMASRGLRDSEEDSEDYEEEEQQEGSEASTDSDEDLDSPRVIRQANVADGSKVQQESAETNPVDPIVQSDTAVAETSSAPDDHSSAPDDHSSAPDDHSSAPDDRNSTPDELSRPDDLKINPVQNEIIESSVDPIDFLPKIETDSSCVGEITTCLSPRPPIDDVISVEDVSVHLPCLHPPEELNHKDSDAPICVGDLSSMPIITKLDSLRSACHKDVLDAQNLGTESTNSVATLHNGPV